MMNVHIVPVVEEDVSVWMSSKGMFFVVFWCSCEKSHYKVVPKYYWGVGVGLQPPRASPSSHCLCHCCTVPSIHIDHELVSLPDSYGAKKVICDVGNGHQCRYHCNLCVCVCVL